MPKSATTPLRHLPPVDGVLRTTIAREAVARFGRTALVAAIRQVLAAARAGGVIPESADHVAAEALKRLEFQGRSNLRPVFNLTGTVLHTNLGRALLADAAIEAAQTAMR